MTEKDEAELKRIIGDLEVADAFIPSKEVVMFDVLHRFITRKRQELLTELLAKAESMETAKEVRHLIKEHLLHD